MPTGGDSLQPASNKSGLSVLGWTVLGAFIGLLVEKFALGLIFGFFVGAAFGANKGRPGASGPDQPPDAGSTT